MKVIGHDDKRACFNIWKMIQDFIPPFSDNFSILIQFHFPIYDFAEQTFPLPRDNCHKIRACLPRRWLRASGIACGRLRAAHANSHILASGLTFYDAFEDQIS